MNKTVFVVYEHCAQSQPNQQLIRQVVASWLSAALRSPPRSP